jgi:serine/threonine protein kinase/tetratricopeptide (TPR) repeat protein
MGEQVIAGRYAIENTIGQGGMGVVYRARDTRTGDVVAVKHLKPDVIKQDPDMVERFDREGIALRKLNHPNIVKVLETVQEDDNYYLVIEYVQGGALSEMLAKGVDFTLEQILNIALDIADALTRAHRLNIIHRDIKPANVLIAEDNTPRLTDFGVARLEDTTRMTATGTFVGTLAYLPPEALSGEGVDLRSDIWAFGIMLYEIIVGERPFTGDNTGALLHAILTKPTPDMLALRPEIPWGLAGLIYWMLEKEPNDRPNSMRLVGTMLENLLTGNDIPLSNFTTNTTRPDGWLPPPDIASRVVREFTAGDYRTIHVDDAESTPPTDTPTSAGTRIAMPDNATVSTSWRSEDPISRADWSVTQKRKLKRPPRIFLSYRRADSIAVTGRLYDRLTMAFGQEAIFKDVDDIPIGVDFRQVLDEQVAQCDVLLAIIGNTYTTLTNEQGVPRLQEPNDFVRIEVEAGLNRPETLVIPVLVNNATMPSTKDLPPSMHELLVRNAATVRNDPDFNRDAEWLINQINNTFDYRPAKQRRARPNNLWQIVAVFMLIFLGFGVLGVFDDFLNGTTPTPTEVPITVAPVADNEIMVLVAQPEDLTGATANANRPVVRALSEYFGGTIDEYGVRIREYPAVITSETQAEAIALEYDAVIVIWSNVNDARTEYHFTLGSLDGYGEISFEREALEELLNFRVHITDPETQTLAMDVLYVLGMLDYISGDLFYNIQAQAYMGRFVNASVPLSEIQGETPAAIMNRVGRLLPTENPESITFMDGIIRADGNPIVLGVRAARHLRFGNLELARRDIVTLQRSAPSEWVYPSFMEAFIALYEDDLDTALTILEDDVLPQLEGDWYSIYLAGVIAYANGDMQRAYDWIQQAIDLEPTANFPYAFATVFALRNVDPTAMQDYLNTALRQFPDPTLGNETIRILIGDTLIGDFRFDLGAIISAFGNITLNQFETAITDLDNAIAVSPDVADLHVIKGFALCSLNRHQEAIDAYTRAIELEDDYLMAYFLRANSQVTIQDMLGATADGVVVLQSPYAEYLSPLIEAGRTGDLTCDNFLTYDFETALVNVERPDVTGGTTETLDTDTALMTATATFGNTTPASIATSAPTDVASIATATPDASAISPTNNQELVLVAQFEPFSDQARNVQRFIVADLTEKLEQSTSFSNIRVQALDQMLFTADEAQSIAQEEGARIIVWGNYDDEIIEANVHLGVIADGIPFTDAEIRRFTDARLYLTNERRVSLATSVLGAINAYYTFSGESFGLARNALIVETLNVTLPEIRDTNLAARFQQFYFNFLDNPDVALEAVNDALIAFPDEPALYAMRGLLYGRLGNRDALLEDMLTSVQIAPDGWSSPYTIVVNEYLLRQDYERALPYSRQLIEDYPNDWFGNALLGVNLFLLGQFDEARIYLEQSIALGAEANFPYAPLVGIELREGNIITAVELTRTIAREYANPTYVQNLLDATMGLEEGETVAFGEFMSAFGYLTLRQWQATIDATQATIDMGLVMSELYFMQGLAYCNLGDDASAEASYSAGIENDPSVEILYLLHAEARRNLGDLAGAAEDTATVAASDQADVLMPIMQAALAGDVTCQNIFDVDYDVILNATP